MRSTHCTTATCPLRFWWRFYGPFTGLFYHVKKVRMKDRIGYAPTPFHSHTGFGYGHRTIVGFDTSAHESVKHNRSRE